MFATVYASCRPVVDRVRVNRVGYWHRYQWWIVLTLIAVVCDFASTSYFMVADGVVHELNPVIRYLAEGLGPIAGPAVGKAMQMGGILLVALYARVLAKPLFACASCSYLAASWYNVWGRQFFNPEVVEWIAQLTR